MSTVSHTLTDPRTLTRPLVQRSTVAWPLTLVVAGAALVAISAQIAIPLPFTPVPITGQTLAVVLVGSALYPFVIGDLLKIYLAALLLPTAWRLTSRSPADR